MQKSLVLIAMCAVGTLASRQADRVNTNMAFASAKMEKIREAHGLPVRAVNGHLKTKLEGALEQAAAPTLSNWFSNLQCDD